jgi:hypothetical protein
MRSKNLTFSGMVFFVNDMKIDTAKFNEIIIAQQISETIGKKVHIFELEYEGTFLKINFADGSAMPRNPNVFNIETNTLEENRRLPSQVEPKEYFAIIDLVNSYLWLSNTKKKSLLLEYFQKLFKNQHIIIKDVYDENKFIELLKTLDQIKISAAPSIFSQTNTVSNALVDEMYGATEAILQLKYQNMFIGDDTLAKIKSFFKNRDSFNSITISGRDEKGLGMLFNNNLFTRKIDIEAIVDENEMFLPSDVFSKLIIKLKNEKKAID